MINQKPFFKRFKKTIIGSALFLVFLLLFANWLGFQHVPRHIRDLYYAIESVVNPHDALAEYKAAHPGEPEPAVESVTVRKPAPISPLDTVYWAKEVKTDNYIPDGIKEELAMIRKTDFSKLKIAEDRPGDTDAQQALVRQYGEEMIKLLADHQAYIRVGKCYQAPLKVRSDGHKEIARVTCMVSAFNDKDGNLGNIQLPLDVIYDFIKVDDDPYTWYVTDFSQTIPYDYALNK